MFVGPDFLQRDDLPPVVIVGSGPAGMTLGISLAERGISSLILEAGEDDFDPDVQDAYVGATTGDPYFDLHATRLRQFGGSSNHWGGWCRPLDTRDFEPVSALGVPGWPIARSDLDPYGPRAREFLEIAETSDQPVGGDIFEADFVFSPPVYFGQKYEAVVRSSPDLHVALRTSVTALLAEDGRIAGLAIVDAQGEARTIAPRIVVVACGGIENSRLLLWSNEVSPQRVVAAPDALGRYWMEHPHEDVGFAVLNRQLHINPRGPVSTYSIGIKPERLIEFGALNAVLRFLYVDLQEIERRVERGVCSLAPELVDVANTVANTGVRCGQKVRAVWEQAPDATNRIELSEVERDRFGIPRTHLFWRKTEQDYRTAKVAFELVGTYLVSNGMGLLQAERHLIEMGDYPVGGGMAGHHHMGGTRMSVSPREGVVDENLRIHGLTNGYVAGSSVFVRSGHANPTYTIVQLSLRLADHLAAELSG